MKTVFFRLRIFLILFFSINFIVNNTNAQLFGSILVSKNQNAYEGKEHTGGNEMPTFSDDNDLPSEDEVRDWIIRAAEAFSELSYKGGYPYMISSDLEIRYNAGHGIKNIFPDETYITIEPPATPWVGRTLLRAYRATGDERLLEMAKETGDAIATVQLDIGGWRMRQPLTDKYSDQYRPDSIPGSGFYPIPPLADLDDNRSQGAALFLVELVRDGSDSERHKKAMEKGLNMLLKAQYPSGGWPQYYPLELEDGYSILDNYRRYNHLNDNSIPDCMIALLAAYRAFGDENYLASVIRAADWLLEVRLPGAGWAQQYYDDFVTGPQKPNSPAPGRWFEPVAITSKETPGVLNILKEIWLETGDDRYIEPFDEVAEWYENSRLECGRWARFYELHTNRPLYCTPDKIVTYSDENLRLGYGWKGKFGKPVFEIVERVKELGRDGIMAERDSVPDDDEIKRLGRAAMKAIEALDERNLWLERRKDAAKRPITGFTAVANYDVQSREFISCSNFNRRMGELCAYLEAIRKRESLQDNELQLKVEQLDKSYENLFVFYANLYDPVTGGFYDCIEKKTPPRIESTCRAISRIDGNGLLDTVPESLKQKWVSFLQSFQDPVTGFFDDPNEHRNIDMRRGRALSYVKVTFKRLGANPKYPYPTVKEKDNFEYDGLIHLKSVDNFNNWLDTLGWDVNSWTAGGTLAAQSGVIASLSSPLKERIVEAMFNFLAAKQNKNGFWGGGSLYVQLSGAFKISSLYRSYDKQMPNASIIFQSTLKCIREEECKYSTWVRNPISLLRVIEPYANITENEKNDISEISINNIMQFYRKDGGFSNSISQKFGTTDGCAQAIITRNFLRDWVGLEPLILPNTDSFLKTLHLTQKN